jgi:DNA-binding transcriptional LysR family regulator
VFGLLARAEERLRGLQSGDSGRFIVGSYHSFGAFFLPGLLTSLARSRRASSSRSGRAPRTR